MHSQIPRIEPAQEKQRKEKKHVTSQSILAKDFCVSCFRFIFSLLTIYILIQKLEISMAETNIVTTPNFKLSISSLIHEKDYKYIWYKKIFFMLPMKIFEMIWALLIIEIRIKIHNFK